MIDFNCPKCGKVLSVPDSNVGERITCPFCDAEVCAPPAVEAASRSRRDPPERLSSICSLSGILMFVGWLSVLIGLLMMATGATAIQEAVALGGCIAFIGGWIIIGLASAVDHLASIKYWLGVVSDQLEDR